MSFQGCLHCLVFLFSLWDCSPPVGVFCESPNVFALPPERSSEAVTAFKKFPLTLRFSTCRKRLPFWREDTSRLKGRALGVGKKVSRCDSSRLELGPPVAIPARESCPLPWQSAEVGACAGDPTGGAPPLH